MKICFTVESNLYTTTTFRTPKFCALLQDGRYLYVIYVVKVQDGPQNGGRFRQVVAFQRWLLMLTKVWLYIKKLFARQQWQCLYKTNVNFRKLENKNIVIFNNWKIISYLYPHVNVFIKIKPSDLLKIPQPKHAPPGNFHMKILR